MKIIATLTAVAVVGVNSPVYAQSQVQDINTKSGETVFEGSDFTNPGGQSKISGVINGFPKAVENGGLVVGTDSTGGSGGEDREE